MSTCDVCGKETNGKEQVVSLHAANLLKKATRKGVMGSSTTSVYKEFSPVEVVACSRHLRTLWSQRAFYAFLVFLLVYIPIGTLIYLVFNLRDNTTLLLVITFILSSIPVYFMVRRITVDGFIASLMNMRPETRAAKLEYFGEAKYQRIVRRLAALDAEIAREDKRK